MKVSIVHDNKNLYIYFKMASKKSRWPPKSLKMRFSLVHKFSTEYSSVSQNNNNNNNNNNNYNNNNNNNNELL